jgi:peroxiredoxin
MDSIISIGEQAPQFQLPNLKGRLHNLSDLLGRIVVLNFWSAECEWCERVDHELTTFLDPWKDEVKVLWIASNTNESGDLIKKVATDRNIPTVLLDTDQQVADVYGAQTTPHFFVINASGKLAYQGAWNDVTFRQRVATQVYVPLVIDALRRNNIPKITQTPPYGCMLVRFPKETS